MSSMPEFRDTDRQNGFQNYIQHFTVCKKYIVIVIEKTDSHQELEEIN